MIYIIFIINQEHNKLMKEQRTSTELPIIIKNLGAMTVIQDTYLVEQIKTAESFVLCTIKTAGRNCVCYYDALVKEGKLKETAIGSIDLFNDNKYYF